MSKDCTEHGSSTTNTPNISASSVRQADAEELVSVVSHDLQNPLNVARVHLERIREEHSGESDHIDGVAQSLDRMEALIDDFLLLTWNGQMLEQRAPVNLALMGNACWQNVESDGASLVVDTTRTVRADAARFQQLLENLFGNSVEHGSTAHRSQAHDGPLDYSDRAVTITLGDLDDGSGFFVEDDGPGIPPEERDRVFEAGYSTSRSGTGLGLYIVQKVAQAHNWNVRLTDGSDGGTRFEITGVEFEE